MGTCAGVKEITNMDNDNVFLNSTRTKDTLFAKYIDKDNKDSHEESFDFSNSDSRGDFGIDLSKFDDNLSSDHNGIAKNNDDDNNNEDIAATIVDHTSINSANKTHRPVLLLSAKKKKKNAGETKGFQERTEDRLTLSKKIKK